MIDWLRKEWAEPEIELAGVALPIVVRRHARAKRLTLRLAPDGSEVRITLPRWARSAEAVAFAHARREWLETQRAKIPCRQAPLPGTTLHLRGEPLRIDWRDDAPRAPLIIDDALIVGGPLESLERRLRLWLEKRALALFEADAREYLHAVGLEPVPVTLSRAQKRWGSCSDRKAIRLNWRLVQAPDAIRRSVVAHEVAHLVHFDHSPAFHALLADLFEGDIAEADAWLKRKGRELYVAFG